MDKSFDELMAEVNSDEPFGGRKLVFREKCGAFAALYGGARNLVIARAFGLSVQSVSRLSGCLESDPEPHKTVTRFRKIDGRQEMVQETEFRDHNAIGRRQPNRHLHYQDVAREFEALGAEEFARRYYTDRIHDRIILAKAAIRDERRRGLVRPINDVPDFSNMSARAMREWKEAHPEKWAELFPQNPT